MYSAVTAGLVAVSLSATAAWADYDTAKKHFDSLSSKDQLEIALGLIGTGDFAGLIDYGFTKRLHKAVLEFEMRRGLTADGILDSSEMRQLDAATKTFYANLNTEYRSHPDSGASLFVPLGLFGNEQKTTQGFAYERADKHLSLSFVAYTASEKSFTQLYEQLSGVGSERTVEYEYFSSAYFVISGRYRGRQFYTWMSAVPSGTTGFTLAWSDDWSETGSKLSVLLANSFVSLPTDKQTDTLTGLCLSALNGQKTGWEPRALFQGSVNEARRRGLTVSDCRVALGLKRITMNYIAPATDRDSLSSLASAIGGRRTYAYLRDAQSGGLCLSALNGPKTGWESRLNFQSSVNEAIRRGLTVDDCRAAIGLAPLTNEEDLQASNQQSILTSDLPAIGDPAKEQPAQVAAQEPNPPSASTGDPRNYNSSLVCGYALSLDKKRWDSYAYKRFVEEAERRSLSVDDCRVVIGLPPLTKQPSTTSSDFEGLRKVALVIGNGAYSHTVELPNPRNDANAVAAMLEGIGFKVVHVVDASKPEMQQAIRNFKSEIKQADISLFYYAGHAIEVAGENYLIPTDALVEDAEALHFELINARIVYENMGDDDRIGIILLDACRDNPFEKSLKRSMAATRAASISSGLAPISTEGGGILVAFATAPGDVAADGDGANSPFTAALLRWLPEKGLEIEQTMKRIKAEVVSMTDDEQRPWTNGNLTTDVYLAGQ